MSTEGDNYWKISMLKAWAKFDINRMVHYKKMTAEEAKRMLEMLKTDDEESLLLLNEILHEKFRQLLP